MSVSRRGLMADSIGASLCASGSREQPYFPPAGSESGWRTLDNASAVRKHTGMDVDRLDAAFQYPKTTSQHGGLLVLRHGYLVY